RRSDRDCDPHDRGSLLQRGECRNAVGHLTEDVVRTREGAAVAPADEELTPDPRGCAGGHGDCTEQVIAHNSVCGHRVAWTSSAGAGWVSCEGDGRRTRAHGTGRRRTHLVKTEPVVEAVLCQVDEVTDRARRVFRAQPDRHEAGRGLDVGAVSAVVWPGGAGHVTAVCMVTKPGVGLDPPVEAQPVTAIPANAATTTVRERTYRDRRANVRWRTEGTPFSSFTIGGQSTHETLVLQSGDQI